MRKQVLIDCSRMCPMKLLYISGYKFLETTDGVFATPSYGDSFWQKYLEVFDEITVLGEPVSFQGDLTKLSKICDKRIKVIILPPNSKPLELKNDFAVRKKLKEAIIDSEAILIKQASRKGNMAIKYAKVFNKPYMIEVTGDMNLDYRTSNSILRKIYRPFLYKRVKKAIRDCKFGLYVTDTYLQRVYPISGETLGCTDAVIKNIDDAVLEKRTQKIKSMPDDKKIIIGMVASYENNRKGIDTAIFALSKLKNKSIELHVLGNGKEKEKEKWMLLAQKNQVNKMLYFDQPLSSAERVFTWIDSIDLMILPSRSEGLPRCIIEAMSRGCPCVTSNVCGLSELIDSDFSHEPNDATALAMLISYLISNKDVLLAQAKKNFEKSRLYQYENISKKRKAFLLSFKEYASGFLKKDKE